MSEPISPTMPDSRTAYSPTPASGFPHHLRRVLRRLAIAVAVVVVLSLLDWLLHGLIGVATGQQFWRDPWSGVLAAALIALAAQSYLGWPSLRNVPAHLQAAFGVTAYVVPLVAGESDSSTWGTVEWTYFTAVLIGAGSALLGAVLGAELPPLTPLLSAARRIAIDVPRTRTAVAALLLIAIAGLSVCFALMGFVPALASNQLSAKFFRGEYAASYARVALPYRLFLAVLLALFPIAALQSIVRRRPAWMALTLVVGVLLLSTLQRGPAVGGILLVIGALLAYRRRAIAGYLIAIVLLYGIGSASVVVLGLLHMGSFVDPSVSITNIPASIAAGAPDIQDQRALLGAWLQRPELTLGRTFWGGLIPGHFPWNPAVWTLTTANPHAQLQDLESGGLRVVAPLWGLFSFGWAGVVLVPMVSGFLAAYLASCARRAISGAPEVRALQYLAYASVAAVLTQFYALDYFSALQTIILLLAVLALPGLTRSRRSKRTREMNRA